MMNAQLGWSGSAWASLGKKTGAERWALSKARMKPLRNGGLTGAGTGPTGAGTGPTGAGTGPTGAGTGPTGAGTGPTGAGTGPTARSDEGTRLQGQHG
uniref:Uncharacterized protein n=1 Tax=Knipowitschia caucasica TaxID=637954 RepID=A0AAV2LUX7_KNICA